jgi:modification target Cys-rich repeat protein
MILLIMKNVDDFSNFTSSLLPFLGNTCRDNCLNTCRDICVILSPSIMSDHADLCSEITQTT